MTLDSVVSEYINENEEGEGKRFRYTAIAISGLRELNMDVSGIPTVTKLTIDENTCRVDLPDDYLKYKRIGICVGGRVISLGRDDTLCLNDNLNACGDQVAIPVAPDSRDFDQQVFNGVPLPTEFWLQGNSGVFGLGGGNNKNGYYRIDEENNQILFASSVSGEIVLEYLSTTKKVKGQSIVNPYCAEALKAFIDWRKINKTLNMGAWQLARQEYYNQRRLAKLRMSTWTLEEIYQALSKSFMQSPKY